MGSEWRAFALSWVVLAGQACNLVDDDEPTAVGSGGTDGSADEQACLDAANTLLAMGCPPGLGPQVFYDGGGSRVVSIDDPGARVGLGVGLVVHFGGEAGADWVGYGVTQNSVCTYGCFAPSCPDGQNGCFAHWMSGGLCANQCSNEPIEQQACDEIQQACLDAEADSGETTGEEGGLDETGGGETTGGGADEPYDCSRWHPEAIEAPEPGGAFLVPQAIVDELVLGSGDALAECDGVRLRQGSGGRWVISKMRTRGLLGALGLRVGDELHAFEGVDLDSLDAIVGVLTASFLTEDGNPRQLSPSHPAFSLKVRRGEGRVELGLKVVPSAAGGGR